MPRVCDLILVLLAAPLWLPLLALTAVLVAVVDGRPVFFTQPRAGRGEKVFTLWKFRTMRPGPGDDGARLTRLGRVLRSTSLDELPELFHVLAGTMALVGPRPLPATYLPRYSPEQARRHAVRPGLTGWAQVHGRNATDWPTRLAHDVWYVDHRSWRLDLAILLRTVAVVCTARGVNQPGQATMDEFKAST